MKQQILIRNILTQILDEIQNLKVPLRTNEKIDHQSIFTTFNFFPINTDEHLDLVEEYLDNEQNFKTTVSIK